MKKGRKGGARQQAVAHFVAKVSSIALGVSCSPLSVRGVFVGRLFDTSADAGGEENDRIEDRARRQTEFLPDGHRRRIPNVAGVEVGDEAEEPLMLLEMDLLFGSPLG